MKRKFIPSILALVLTLSCSLFSSGGTTQPADNPDPVASVDIPAVDFDAPANPINVTVELDDTQSTSGMFSTNGGVMSLTASDGTVFTLEIPAGALDVDTAITMTVVKKMAGAPLSGDVFAVQLEPSGLFLNEFATLTIQPALEIPINEQIVFGYEGAGTDYHFALVDPKSREIKVKLLEFSGAGVGRGADAEWAATLKSMAEQSRIRLTSQAAAILQKERMQQLLGMEDLGDDISALEKVESLSNKFYDQVIFKEIAAAELDCRHAKKALHDLISLERQHQLLGVNSPIVDFEGKFARLLKIGENCTQGYTASGSGEGVTITGSICGTVDAPFSLTGAMEGGGAVEFDFMPANEQGGNSQYTGSGGGFTFSGSGTYTISGEDGSPLTLVMKNSGCVDGVADSCRETSETITLTPTDSCRQ